MGEKEGAWWWEAVLSVAGVASGDRGEVWGREGSLALSGWH